MLMRAFELVEDSRLAVVAEFEPKWLLIELESKFELACLHELDLKLLLGQLV